MSFSTLTWDQFLDFGFHDVAGISGSIDDSNVTVGPFTDLLLGATSQEAVNTILDSLGSTTGSGQIGILDSYTGLLSTSTDLQDALDQLDKLQSNVNGEGASLILVEDAADNFTSTNVENVLEEIYSQVIDAATISKTSEVLPSLLSSATSHTIPDSLSYTVADGDNMDVYLNGQLLLAGLGNDYLEEGSAGTLSTSLRFNFNVRSGSILTYIVRS